MGCFLACLRFKDDKKKKKAHLKSSPVPSKTKEPMLLKDQFVSMFVSEEIGSPCERVADLNSQDDIDKDIWDREFRDEVKFLKSCGAILQTPAELRKASEKLIDQQPNKDVMSSGSSSCLPGTPFKKLVWDEQQEDSNVTQNSFAGFNFGEHQAQKHDDSALSSVILRKSGPESAVLDVFPAQDDTQIQPYSTKGSFYSGSFALDSGIESRPESAVLDVSPTQDDTQIQALVSNGACLGSVNHDRETKPGAVAVVLDVSPSQDDTQVQPFGAKHSPYPTPLKLTDEMETPGTIHPASLENLRRKNARIRTQYVYRVLNPVENLNQWAKLREGSKHPGQSKKAQQTPIASSANNQNDKRSLNRDELDKENYGSVKRPRSLTLLSDSRWKLKPSPENRQVVVSSLSQWLKPPPGDEEKSRTETSATKYSCPDRTPEVDRPILEAVAMHWNEDDPSKVSPKWLCGNGIPNTTTKYKEDQKVSWHATPFEERLDKALSDDKLFPQRKDVSRNLTAFKDEGEESDTARF